ncbi:heavy metal translocating P-type ATPase [Vibrio sp. THAF190c]|uniref:heavy metal translocating P-type ATPase n=1 Tax=Vibrio sp. THAF190c TaxID=2587865 RepID=UPI001268D276|nr:heavy metal translocating P-type ATPase [Vibrio sp. THAF190c]QFT13343.1 Copper-exporting P-type ATPase A [Vibrio sp. THAF190c]
MNTTQYSLALSGINCGRCVAKIVDELRERDPDVSFTINETKHRAELITTLMPESAIEVIAKLGYVASIPTQQEYRTSVSNVTCQHCVGKITKAIVELDATAQVVVDLDKQTLVVNSSLNGDEIESVLVEQGYSGSTDGTQPQTTDVTKSNKVKTTQAVDVSIELSLIGVTCASCVNTIEGALRSVSGVDSVDVNFANRTATVVSSQPASVLIEAIQGAGYDAEEIVDQALASDLKEEREAEEYRFKVKQSVIGLGLGVPLMVYGLFGGPMNVNTQSEQLLWLAVGLVTFFILVRAGKHFFTGAWKTFLSRNANMDTLIALGTGTAWLYSMVVVVGPQWLPESARHLYFEATAMIIGLINLGQALELKARGRTSQAIKRLLDLRVKTAMVIRDGKEMSIPIEQVIARDLIRVRAGEKVPVDGVITEGETTIDESMLTGEPIPVVKQVGSSVSAGTINDHGSFVFEAQKVGSDTVLAQIISMVSNAQNSKPPISHLADKVSSVFVPTVMILSILTALAWYNFGPQPSLVYMIVAATSVLIIACPCALGLATPISTMIGVGKAAEFGGLIRNGEALQRASELDVVVLDKTGTITQGKPEVTNFVLLSEDSELLPLVNALEKGSNHPLAKALIAFTQSEVSDEANLLEVSDFESLTGLGVQAQYASQRVLLGNRKLMNQFKVNVESVTEHALQWEQEANTVVYFAIGDQLKALFGISDPIRDDARSAINRFHQQGIHVVMLTGDNHNTAKAVASLANVDEYHAQLMPEDKLHWIKQLQAKGHVVGMVGDGINDAPALAQSDVGFAIGSGTDVAIESADITLMRSSLHGISDVIGISTATMKNIKQNLWGAFIYNSLGIPVAAGLLFPFTGWLLSPIIAGAAMSLSSVTVVTNANRLRLYTPPSAPTTNEE